MLFERSHCDGDLECVIIMHGLQYLREMFHINYKSIHWIYCRSNCYTWIFSSTNTNNEIYSNILVIIHSFIQLIHALTPVSQQFKHLFNNICSFSAKFKSLLWLLFVQIFCKISIINIFLIKYLFTNIKSSAIKWFWMCRNLFQINVICYSIPFVKNNNPKYRWGLQMQIIFIASFNQPTLCLAV